MVLLQKIKIYGKSVKVENLALSTKYILFYYQLLNNSTFQLQIIYNDHHSIKLFMSIQPGTILNSKLIQTEPKSKDCFPVKLSLLEDKAHFFEGQFNPLHSQNMQLKEQLIYAKRIITQKTKLLKGMLLPIDKNGKSRQLFMDTATLQEICVLIEEDWKDLRSSNSQLRQQVNNLNITLKEQSQEFQKITKELSKQIQQLNTKILSLTNQKQNLIRENQLSLQNIAKQFNLKLQNKERQIQMKNRQNDTLKENLKALQAEMNRKTDENRHRMKMLQNDYDTLEAKCEEAKRLLGILFESQMKEKIQQLNRGFEAVLLAREQQYNDTISLLKAKEEELVLQIFQKEEDIKKQIETRVQKEKQLANYVEKRKELQKLNQKIQSEKVRCMNQIDKLKVQRAGLLENIKQKDKQIQVAAQKYQSSRQQYLRQRTKMKQHLQTVQNQLMQSKKQNFNQKTAYQKQISSLKNDMNQQISNLNIRIKVSDEQWNQKYKRVIMTNIELDSMIKDQKRRNQQMIKQVQKTRTQCQQKIIQQRQKSNQRVELARSEQQQRRKALEEQHKIQKIQWQRAVQMRINEVKTQMKQQIEELRQQKIKLQATHRQQITKIREEQAEQIKKIQEQHTKERQQNQKDKQEIRHAMALKVQEINQIVKIMEQRIIEKNRQIQKQKQEMKLALQAERTKFEDRLTALKESFEEEKAAISKAFDQKIINLTHSFQQKMQELRALNQTQQLSNHYQEQIIKMNQKFNLQRIKLQEQFQNKIKQLVDENQKKNEEIKKSYQIRIKEVEIERVKQIEELRKQLQKEREEHQLQLTQLSRRFEEDIGSINNLLIEEKQQHHTTKMTKQQKIDYLNQKIIDMKTSFKTLEQAKSLLEDQLLNKQKQFRMMEQRIYEIVEQRIKQFQQQKAKYKELVYQKVLQKQAECTIKIKQYMQQNLKFSSEIHLQFQKMRAIHEDQISECELKYADLEQLFMQRPSRPEDIHIIKQLKDKREQMQKIVEVAEKRVKAANQIVKYLQLQLQNYKETYNIFGPNGQFQQDQIIPKKLRLSTNVTQQIHEMRKQQRQLNDSPFYNQRIQTQIRKSVSIKVNEFPPISKTSAVDVIETKSFEVIQGAQRFMESIHKGNKQLSSPLVRKRRSPSVKKKREQTVNESSTMQNNSQFHIKPRRVSIKKNSVAF